MLRPNSWCARKKSEWAHHEILRFHLEYRKKIIHAILLLVAYEILLDRDRLDGWVHVQLVSQISVSVLAVVLIVAEL